VVLALAEDQPQKLAVVVGGGVGPNQLGDGSRLLARVDLSVGGADRDAGDDTYGPATTIA